MTCTATSNCHTASTMIETLQPMQQPMPLLHQHHHHHQHHNPQYQQQQPQPQQAQPNKWLYEIRQRGQNADSVATTCYVMVPNATVSPFYFQSPYLVTRSGADAELFIYKSSRAMVHINHKSNTCGPKTDRQIDRQKHTQSQNASCTGLRKTGVAGGQAAAATVVDVCVVCKRKKSTQQTQTH